MSEACSHDCSSCGSDCAEREVPQNTRNDNNKNIIYTSQLVDALKGD